MKTALPTAEELQKLTVRALVAYSARATRRLSGQLRGIVADGILDESLRLVDNVSASAQIEKASIVRAAEGVVAAYADAPADMKSLEKFRVVFAFCHSALAAVHALLASVGSHDAAEELESAAKEAYRAVNVVEVLSGNAAAEAIEAARRDYEVLIREYGEHDSVVIGDPVNCF